MRPSRTVQDDLAALGITDLSRVTMDGKPMAKKPVPLTQLTLHENQYDCLTLRLPLPLPECSPNSRCHWSKKARAAKAMRAAARRAASTFITAFGQSFIRPIITATFYHRTRRVRDRDNAIASTKNQIDGLADAGLFLNDSQVHWGDISFEIDKQDPRVMLTIRERP